MARISFAQQLFAPPGREPQAAPPQLPQRPAQQMSRSVLPAGAAAKMPVAQRPATLTCDLTLLMNLPPGSSGGGGLGGGG